MTRTQAFLVAMLLIAYFSLEQTQLKSTEPSLPCDGKEQVAEENHKAIWFTSNQMKHRATWKVDVGGILKNADVNGTVIASVIVGKNGEVACLKIINPKHPLIVSAVDKALRQWKVQPMEQHGKPVGYVGWLQFRCRIGCAEGKSSVTLLD